MKVVDPAPGTTGTLPADLRSLVGRVGTPTVRQVRAEDVRRFLLATAADRTPSDLSAHRQAPRVAPGDVVPPTFFCPDPIIAAESMGLPRPRPYSRNIDGGSEWDFRRSVRVGDALTLVPRIAEVTGRVTSDGRRMVVTVVEITARNEEGALVGVARGRCLSYEEAA